jgi:CHASE2 domain-containing sensor protein
MAESAWLTTTDSSRNESSGETTRIAVERSVLVAACAVSAGIHGALVRDHLAEGVSLGVGFLIATVLLIGLAGALTNRADRQLLLASAAVMAGLIVAYLFAITTGLPLLHPEVETADGLAVFTKSVEALGLVVALDLLGRTGLTLHSDERTTT